jgi:hypothetical protein
MERLLYIDEHAISVDTSAVATWAALLRVMCADPADPSTVRVGSLHEAIPQRRLALNGRHLCFADYRLVFEMDTDTDTDESLLRARTWATFHGLRGQVFRALAIGGGVHRLVVRTILKQVVAQAHSLESSVS